MPVSGVSTGGHRLAALGCREFGILAITGDQTSKEVTRYIKGATRKLRAASALARLTQPREKAKNLSAFATRPECGTILPRNDLKNQFHLGEWQPVGESNPSFQVENLAS